MFVELGMIIFISVILAAIMRILRQPLIIGYILTGVLVSPYVLNIVHYTDTIATFAHMGVALLLFMVGLNLRPTVIREVGKVSIIVGLGQVIFTALIGFMICIALGFSQIDAIYISFALTFSSTIIIMKLISDKGEVDALYSKIAIGLLIVQDLIAIVMLILITYFTTSISFTHISVDTIIQAIGTLLLVVVMGIILPHITTAMAKSQELLLMFSVAWCLLLASLFYMLGLSIEIGALLAGVSLSVSPYRQEISSKMRLLRDFFLVLFFVLLGTQMAFGGVWENIVPIALLSLFVLIGNPLIVLVLMGLLGYTRRTSFLVGLTVAQISEFSFILISLGIKAGHLTGNTLSIVTVVGLITIAGSSYFILYSNKIYAYLSNYLKIFERQGRKVDEFARMRAKDYDTILFGYNRIGYDIVAELKKLHINFVVVDYNPQVIAESERAGLNCVYGDASDGELLDDLKISEKRMVISTIPDHDMNMLLLHRIRDKNAGSVVIAVAHRIDDALELYREGATYVLMPHFIGGHYTSLMIEKFGFDNRRYLKERSTHIRRLLEKKRIGHEHPVHERH